MSVDNIILEKNLKRLERKIGASRTIVESFISLEKYFRFNKRTAPVIEQTDEENKKRTKQKSLVLFLF